MCLMNVTGGMKPNVHNLRRGKHSKFLSPFRAEVFSTKIGPYAGLSFSSLFTTARIRHRVERVKTNTHYYYSSKTFQRKINQG